MADLDGFGVSGIITLVVALLLSAALVPPAISSATNADFSSRTDTIQLQTGETYNLSDVNTSVTFDSYTQTNATYALENGGSSSITLQEGENGTVTVSDVSYNVSLESLDTANNQSTIEVQYNVSEGGTAQSVWGMVPLFIVLAIALYFIQFAVSGSDRI